MIETSKLDEIRKRNDGVVQEIYVPTKIGHDILQQAKTPIEYRWMKEILRFEPTISTKK